MAFGDGSDGDVVLTTDTTLTADMNYNNLTIDAGVTLYPDGYVIYVYDTLTVNGTINRNGHSGSGRTPGTALPTNTVGGSGGGGAGGPIGYDGEDAEDVSGIAGRNGGDGGTVYGPFGEYRYDGGTCGETNPFHVVVDNDVDDIITNAATRLGGPGGGGGGSFVAQQYYRAGGGGGSGAGVVYISARNVVISSTGVLLLKGGAGGTVDGVVGGGGGGGGCIILEYTSITDNGEVNVNGGQGGDTQGGGTPASPGTSGIIYLFEIEAIAVDDTVPDSFTFGRIGKKRRHRIEV